MANGMESTGAKFGIGTNRAQYPGLHQQVRSFGQMKPSLSSGPVTGTKPLAGGSQAAGMIRQPGPTMPRSGGMVGDNPVFKPRPPAGGVTGTLPKGGLQPIGTGPRPLPPSARPPLGQSGPGQGGMVRPGGPNMQGPWPGMRGKGPGMVTNPLVRPGKNPNPRPDGSSLRPLGNVLGPKNPLMKNPAGRKLR
jgi:hypothetical protein